MNIYDIWNLQKQGHGLLPVAAFANAARFAAEAPLCGFLALGIPNYHPFILSSEPSPGRRRFQGPGSNFCRTIKDFDSCEKISQKFGCELLTESPSPLSRQGWYLKSGEVRLCLSIWVMSSWPQHLVAKVLDFCGGGELFFHMLHRGRFEDGGRIWKNCTGSPLVSPQKLLAELQRSWPNWNQQLFAEWSLPS